MIGPEGAAELVAAWLAARIPLRLVAIELERGLEVGSTGAPALVLPYDRLRLGVEEWPAILVVGQALRRLSPVDLTDGVSSYRATYALRVFAWVRADGEQEVDALRKRYALAVRESLLEASLMGGDGSIATDPRSLAESYSDLIVDDAGATIAGVWTDVDVDVVEVLTAAPVDLAGAPAPDRRLEQPVDLDTHRLPAHPAL